MRLLNLFSISIFCENVSARNLIGRMTHTVGYLGIYLQYYGPKSCGMFWYFRLCLRNLMFWSWFSYFLEFSIVEYLPHDNKIASKVGESNFPITACETENVYPLKPWPRTQLWVMEPWKPEKSLTLWIFGTHGWVTGNKTFFFLCLYKNQVDQLIWDVCPNKTQHLVEFFVRIFVYWWLPREVVIWVDSFSISKNSVSLKKKNTGWVLVQIFRRIHGYLFTFIYRTFYIFLFSCMLRLNGAHTVLCSKFDFLKFRNKL